MRKLCMFLAPLAFLAIIFFGCSNEKEPEYSVSSSSNDSSDSNNPSGNGSSSSSNPSGTSSSDSVIGESSSSGETILDNSSSSTGNINTISACIPPPGYGEPPNGVETCIEVDDKCYICNPDRGNDCLQPWLWQENPSINEWWYSEISCEEASNSGSANTPTLTCEGLAAKGIVGATIAQPTVSCNGTALNSGITWSGQPNWSNPTAATYNVSAAANCGGSSITASCGTIEVSAATSNTLTCTNMSTTGIAGTAITQPTVMCGSTAISSSSVSWQNAPIWNNPTANTYNVSATATCSGSSQTANCGTLKVSPKLTCGSVTTQTVVAGTAVTAPTVTCGSTTLASSAISWTGAPTLWSSPTQGTYNNIQARATSGDCNGQTASCSGTLTVSPKLDCGNLSQTITTTQTPTKPSVTCGSTSVSTTITWRSNNNSISLDNALAQGSYSNITATASCGSITQTANCSGTITVNAASTSSSSSGSSNNSLTALTSGGDGWASRYWDACKPSCGWSGNAGGNPTKSCAKDGLTKVSNDAQSICATNSGTAYTCYDQAPIVVGEVVYAFAASHSNADCGKCFQLTFKGTSQHESPSSTLTHIKGKSMIIRISNIGGDVQGTQYDLMIPGGGTGYYDSFSYQLGLSSTYTTISTDQNIDQGVLGMRYGGLATKCINEKGSNASLSTLQSCLNDKCDAAFGSVNSNLNAGCKLYASWFGVANNPQFWSKQVDCPTELTNRWQ